MIAKPSKGLRGNLRRLRGRIGMAVGRASSTEPLCDNFGFSRGTPVDRHYIEAFLAEHARDIGGRVLEVGDDLYSRRFGGGRIVRQDVLHVSPGQRAATITGDVSDDGVLPKSTFDCIIFTQTLHLVFDVAKAIAFLHAALRPGGVLLLTSPGISPVDRGEWKESWYWSLSEQSMSRLLSASFDPADVKVRAYGNLFSATAFLHGAAVEDTGTRRLEAVDPAYPVVVAARARRAA